MKEQKPSSLEKEVRKIIKDLLCLMCDFPSCYGRRRKYCPKFISTKERVLALIKREKERIKKKVVKYLVNWEYTSKPAAQKRKDVDNLFNEVDDG